MSNPEAMDVATVWQTWVEAYGYLRQLPLETATYGWWIDVAKAQQSGRYLLRQADVAVLQRLAEGGHDPAVHFELPVAGEIVAQVLPPGWTLAVPEYLMTAPVAAPAIQALSNHVQMLLDVEEDVIRASCADEDGMALSCGVCLVFGRDAIFDQIVTEPASRRQGLASAVMGVLMAAAATRGATRGVLLAAVEGRPLYEKLGWTVLSEVSKAVSPVESRTARHLRMASRH